MNNKHNVINGDIYMGSMKELKGANHTMSALLILQALLFVFNVIFVNIEIFSWVIIVLFIATVWLKIEFLRTITRRIVDEHRVCRPNACKYCGL